MLASAPPVRTCGRAIVCAAMTPYTAFIIHPKRSQPAHSLYTTLTGPVACHHGAR